jgi:hypothetical protein
VVKHPFLNQTSERQSAYTDTQDTNKETQMENVINDNSKTCKDAENLRTWNDVWIKDAKDE